MDAVIVSDNVIIAGNSTILTLSIHGKLNWREGSKPLCLSIEKDVLGFMVEGSTIRLKIVVDGEIERCSFFHRENINRKFLVFEPSSEKVKQQWCENIQHRLDSLGRPKNLFIFINPFGGRKSASRIFFNEVKPLLDDAEIKFTLLETKHQSHAKDVAHSLDLKNHDGIVCVSGDGILVEVINGLLEREDWKTAILMPIGVIPAGSGNGMAKSLLDSSGLPCTVTNATLSIIRGRKSALDVATISQGERKYFSVLMLAWGLVADIDIESEKYRWMGGARLNVYALQRILFLRKYNGRISFVPAPGFESFGTPSSNEIEFPTSHHKLPGCPGSLDSFESGSWRTIDGPFVMVCLQNVAWSSEDALFSPDSKLGDGCLGLVVVKNCTKRELLKGFMELGKGDLLKSTFVDYLKVKALVMVVGQCVGDERRGGIINVDGEILAKGDYTDTCHVSNRMIPMNYDRMHIGVHPRLATLFSP